MFASLVDERTLAPTIGRMLPYPLRLFDLKEWGIDSQRFLADMAPTFYDLEWDMYAVKLEQLRFLRFHFPEQRENVERFFNDYYNYRIPLVAVKGLVAGISSDEYNILASMRPYRRRSISRFHLAYEVKRGLWSIERLFEGSFTQAVGAGDYRKQSRTFREASPAVTDHMLFRRVLLNLAEEIRSIRPEVKHLRITCHQMGLVARPQAYADNAPEGIHQDGADYIISALVIERRGVKGGVSTVYGPDKRTEYLSATLLPGQGIFQADRGTDLWHDVSPVTIEDPCSQTEGVRNILGFDVMVE
jgi:hypothetical protein